MPKSTNTSSGLLDLTNDENFHRYIILQENLSTVRFISYLISETRVARPVVEVSYSELANLLNLSRCAVQDGVKRAIEAGYVQLLQAGENGLVRARYALRLPSSPPPDHLPLCTEKQEGILHRAEKEATCQMVFQATPALEPNHDSNSSNKVNLEKLESVRPAAGKTADRILTPPAAPSISTSVYLTNLARDFSRELKDTAHVRSNITQIHNLWQLSGISQQEFAGKMYHARNLTRWYAHPNPAKAYPNTMAYFFTTLRNLLRLSNNKASGYALADKAQPEIGNDHAPPASSFPAPLPRLPQQAVNKPKVPSTVVAIRPIPQSWLRFSSRATSTSG